MTQEDLKQVANEHPFRPFTIHLADGSQLGVSHPDAIAVGSRTAILIVPDSTRESGDRSVTLAIRHITKLEREEPAQSNDNGAN